MSINQQKNGYWLVDIQKQNLKRVRKSFKTKKEAELFELNYLAANNDHISPKISDERRLSELIELWYKYHGVNLADHEKHRRLLLVMASKLKNPIASELTAESFVNYRYNRLVEGLNAKTFNNYLCVFLCFCVSSAFAKVYKCENEKGKLSYQEKPCAGNEKRKGEFLTPKDKESIKRNEIDFQRKKLEDDLKAHSKKLDDDDKKRREEIKIEKIRRKKLRLKTLEDAKTKAKKDFEEKSDKVIAEVKSGKLSKREGKAILKKEFFVGMTEYALVLSLGFPGKKNLSAFSLEQWIYGLGTYIYLKNGVIVNWQLLD